MSAPVSLMACKQPVARMGDDSVGLYEGNYSVPLLWLALFRPSDLQRDPALEGPGWYFSSPTDLALARLAARVPRLECVLSEESRSALSAFKARCEARRQSHFFAGINEAVCMSGEAEARALFSAFFEAVDSPNPPEVHSGLLLRLFGSTPTIPAWRFVDRHYGNAVNAPRCPLHVLVGSEDDDAGQLDA